MIGFTAPKLRQRDWYRFPFWVDFVCLSHDRATFLGAGWWTCYHIIQFFLQNYESLSIDNLVGIADRLDWLNDINYSLGIQPPKYGNMECTQHGIHEFD